MTHDHKPHRSDFDWRTTSFEGARREQLRRWAQLPLENILLAIEEMQDIAQAFGTVPAGGSGTPPVSESSVRSFNPTLHKQVGQN